MRGMLLIVASTLLVGGGAASASAQALTDKTILSDFNAVVYTNGSTPSDIEGAAVIGGNFSGATVLNNPNDGGVRSQPAGYGALTVFGSTSGNFINIDNGGSAYVGGTRGAGINFNGGGGYLASAPQNTIGQFETPLNSLSMSLAGLAANSVFPATGNNEVIAATAGPNGVAVFDVTSATLDAIPSYQVSFGSATTIIVNVDAESTGGIVNFNGNAEGLSTYGNEHILWNFYNANVVDLGTQFGGSVLAPLANVVNANQIDGDLVARTWTGSGELHSFAYQGWLPQGGVPEPATWALMIVGFGMVGAATRRRARANVAPA